ncbi:MAG: MalY/PatB family protein [Bacillota bacterium]
MDFDKFIDRSNNLSSKWDEIEEKFNVGDADEILPFWVADMDFRSPEPVINAVVEKAKQGIYGYTSRPESYNKAIINWYRNRHNWSIKKEWLSFSPGIVPALSFIVNSFTNRGDKVIIQPPVYYPFYNVINNNGCHIQENPLILEKGKYIMDFDDLSRKAKDPRTKLLILCSPHNPVGRVWKEKELSKLGEICLDNNVTIVSDEIHCDLTYSGHEHIPFASISREFEQNSITCVAPSKTFNLAGLQASSIVIPNEGARKIFKNHMDTVHLTRNNALSVVAAEAAYNYGEEWLDELLIYLEENLNYLIDFFEKNLPEINVIHPEGTYLVWLDFRELDLGSDELSDLMINQAKVALDDGFWFGEQGIGFERINIACPRSLLKNGLNRIKEAVKNM